MEIQKAGWKGKLMRIKILSIAGIIAALVIGSSAWILESGESNKNASTDKITLRYLYGTTNANPWELAEELGYLEEENIVLERVGTSTSGPEQIMAVSSGSTDIGGSNWAPVLNTIARGGNIVPVTTSYGFNKERDAYWIVLNDSGINDARDLKGKTIAVNVLGAHWDYATRKYLKQNGLSIKDVQLIVVPPVQSDQVLRSRQVDVVTAAEPISDKIFEKGNVRILTTLYKVNGDKDSGSGPLFFRDDFVKKHPEVVRKFVRATVKAVDWSREHPEEAKQLIANILKKNGGNPDLAKYFKGFGIREHALILDEDVAFWLDQLVEEGKLEAGKYKSSDFYTNEFNPYYKK